MCLLACRYATIIYSTAQQASQSPIEESFSHTRGLHQPLTASYDRSLNVGQKCRTNTLTQAQEVEVVATERLLPVNRAATDSSSSSRTVVALAEATVRPLLSSKLAMVADMAVLPLLVSNKADTVRLLPANSKEDTAVQVSSHPTARRLRATVDHKYSTPQQALLLEPIHSCGSGSSLSTAIEAVRSMRKNSARHSSMETGLPSTWIRSRCS